MEGKEREFMVRIYISITTSGHGECLHVLTLYPLMIFITKIKFYLASNIFKQHKGDAPFMIKFFSFI